MLLLAQESGTWFTPRRISWVTGIPLATARQQCFRLHWWNRPYIRRRKVGSYFGTYHYEYRIGVRGIDWVNHALDSGLPLDKLVQEVRDYQQQRDVELRGGGVDE